MIIRIKWAEAHHLYIGLLLFIGGPVGVVLGLDEMLGFIIAMLGFWLIMDDLYQHWRQMFQPGYRSWCHRLFQWLWRNTLGRFITWPKNL
jgi:hypothetical protein